MILINVQFHVKPEYAETFLDEINWYTEACNAEPGCIDFKWFRDPEDRQRFLLLESYADGKDVEHVPERALPALLRGIPEVPRGNSGHH